MEEFLKPFIETASAAISFIYGIFGAVYGFYAQYQEILSPALKFLTGVLTVYLLFRLFIETWIFYRRTLFKNDIQWSLLEIKIPREVMKTPRAMEQFFINVHGLRNTAGDFIEKYFDGVVTLWWSLEIASFGGEIHFYIRTPKKHKKTVEAGLYAQYPTAEISETSDYIEDFPKSTEEIYKKDYNLFGGELILKKEDAYPITTYEKFELSKDEMAIDPISALFEVLGALNKEETFLFQILIRPAGSEWQEEGKKMIDKLIGRKKDEPAKKTAPATAYEWLKNIFMAPVEAPQWSSAKEEKKEKLDLNVLTSGEKETVKAIEESISKPGFETLIRYIYYAPKLDFSAGFSKSGFIGALNQYSSQVLNSFKGNSAVETQSKWIYFPYIFIPQRVEARKQRILYNFHNRKLPEESFWAKVYTSHPMNFNTKSKIFILNTAELATIFHIPAEQVLTAPHTKRLESKKMGPPAGLPIFEEEKTEK